MVKKMWLLSRKDCPMRHENGNCTAAGGFCTAVNDPICEALRNAFKCGEYSKIEWATLALAKQATLFEEKQLAVLQEIHEKVTADIEPKEQGRWIERIDHFSCSACGGDCWALSASEYNYCPNCGAKMKGDQK